MAATLKELRKAKGLTQSEVAQLLGFQSTSAYHAIENRKRKYCTPAVLQTLATTFGVPVDKIVTAIGGQ